MMDMTERVARAIFERRMRSLHPDRDITKLPWGVAGGEVQLDAIAEAVARHDFDGCAAGVKAYMDLHPGMTMPQALDSIFGDGPRPPGFAENKTVQ